ncbi:hypothetical protein MAC_07646 [Metarhizium acridum CQMa 102]|uniref:Tyrosine-protein phosphatase non-receptor type 6 n=1 Tax=Metarhizium acridum (strain CQMa 102) TaxID=655827 RepID=E9ECP8_METAQ|nr:uncharacterized protein MAC_07646 [Metarhizium acridum CQMa 102]EFY86342.1 hypothetical protein MAC_07646 [Metarhizium acridum CQMa 102]
MDPVHSLADATAAAAVASSSSPSMLATVRDEDGCNPIESAAPTPGVVADTVKSTTPPSPPAKVDGSLVRHAMYSPTSPRLIHSDSPPPRKDTLSSISTQATTATTASAETNNTSYSADTSPSLHQSIFSSKDGSDVSNTRRASRRRTGPLSQQSRERAALIRKLGACHDCRRRRVASPNNQDVTPSIGAGRPLSPASSLSTLQPSFAHETQEMDIDSSPTAHHQPGRHPLSEARIRTPLPSGPRLEKSLSLPGIESLKNELQHNVPKILSTTHRGRYNSVQVLLLFWHDDEDATTIQDAVRELAHVFDRSYHYTFHIQAIPSASDSSKSSWRWLSRRLNDFAEDCDQRDVLKIVYYAGHTCLDGNREMILTSSRDKDQASTIRWSGMQQILEETCADVLILMDAAYYPSSKIVRRKGVLELLAASASEDHAASLGRCAFTRALSELLSARAARSAPLSVVELHALLLSHYPKIVRDTTPERETVTTFPVPLHTMMSGNSRLPSVFLSPIHHHSPMRNSFSYENNPQLHLSIRLTDDNVDIESWNEWLRLMPEGVKDVKIDGPFRPTFRPG